MKLLFDNTTLFGEAVARILRNNKQVFLIKERFDDTNIVEIIKQKHPNVIIVDTDYCFDCAGKITRIIKKDFPKIKVISLYLWNKTLYEQEMLAAGADAHLSKVDDSLELFKAIKSTKRRS